jgi:hypothetical protein
MPRTLRCSLNGSREITRTSNVSFYSHRIRFQITNDNFFSLARVADKFIIPHLNDTLKYYSHTLIADSRPSYELWLQAAKHDMILIEKFCRNAARTEVGRMLAQKGISYFIVEEGIRPGAMDEIIMDLLRVKDQYMAYRQVNSSLNRNGGN